MKWKRMKDGTLQSSQATIMKNAEGSYIAIGAWLATSFDACAARKRGATMTSRRGAADGGEMRERIEPGDLAPGTVLYRVRHAGVSPRSIQRATVLAPLSDDRVQMRGQRGNLWGATCAGLTVSGYALTEAGAARLAAQQWARVVEGCERELAQARARAAEADALLASLTEAPQ